MNATEEGAYLASRFSFLPGYEVENLPDLRGRQARVSKGMQTLLSKAVMLLMAQMVLTISLPW